MTTWQLTMLFFCIGLGLVYLNDIKTELRSIRRILSDAHEKPDIDLDC